MKRTEFINQKHNRGRFRIGTFTLFLYLIIVLGFAHFSNAQSVTSPQFIKDNDTIVVYKDVPNQLPSDKYTIRIKSAATNNEWVDVYANYTYNRNFELPQDQIKFGGNINYHYQIKTDKWSHTYGNIEMSKNTTVDVEIAFKDPNFTIVGLPLTKAAAHPSHTVSSPPVVTNGKVYFSINKPGQISIDINGQMDDYHYAINPYQGDIKKNIVHAISLFANPVMKKPSLADPNVVAVEPGSTPPTNLDIGKTLYFKPGVHTIGMNYKVLPGRNYYIPGDAIVYGTMNNIGGSGVGNKRSGEDIKIYGYGTISHYGIHHPDYILPTPPVDYNEHCPIFITDGMNVEIIGISIADPSFHSLKLQDWGGRPDKFSIETKCKWIKIISWRSNGDGIGSAELVEDSYFRTTDDASYLKGKRIRCIFWRDIHAAGFHMAGTPSASSSFQLIVEDCDAIYLRSRDAVGYNGGIFHNRAEGVLGQHTVNVIVRNFRSEDPLANSPFFNMYSKDDSGAIGSSYTGIVFQNINIESDNTTMKQVLTGCLEAPWDGGITFDNVTFKGVLLTKDNFTNYFITNEFTKNIIFKNSVNYSLTLGSNQNGSIKPSSALPSFVDGTTVTLTAVPAPGYEFVGWTGDLTGTINPVDIVMSANKTISATFQKTSTYIFETPGPGSWIVPEGVTSITLKTWGAGGAGGSAYSGTATANTQARSGGGSGGSFASKIINVTPGQVINFTIGAGGSGAESGFAHSTFGASGATTIATTNNQTIVSAVGGSGGENVSITNLVYNGKGGVAPTSGNIGDVIYYGGNGGTAASGGSGGGGGSAGELGNGGNGSIITPGTAGTGGGAEGGTGTNLGGQTPTSGKTPGAGGGGAIVRNSATNNFPENNVHRTGASGANGKLMIIIPEIRYTLATSSNPLQGSVTVNPVQETYAENSSVTLTAIANAGYTFLNWSGAVSGTANPISINMDNNKNVVANFVAIQHQVSLSVNGGIGGTVSGGGTYNQGQSITVLATPSAGYSFVHWTENDIPVSTNASYTFNVDQARVLMAQFQVIAPNQTPYLGTAATIPGIIEAEKYDEGGQGIAYNDDATKQGNTSYRPADMVDVVSKSTASNGYVAGFSITGEWLEYTVNVTPGTYDLKLNYFCNSTTAGDLKVSLDGVLLTTITEIVSQGSTTIQGTVTVPNLTVAGGSGKVLRLEYVGSKFDIDAIQFSACSDNLPWSTLNVSVNKATLNKTYPVINTSCASSVSISVDVEGIGSLESSDYCRVYYRIDGGALQTLVNKTGAFAKQTFTVTGLNANSIEIVINAKASASDETYNLSNIKVFQTGSQVARIANTNKNGSTNLNKEIKIYPNPVSSFLNINFSNAGTSKEIKIFNLLGQMVYTTTTVNNEVQIDMQSLNLKGVVIVQVTEEDVVSDFKVIVK